MNPANLVFWLLAHIVYDKDLMETIRKETAPAFTSNGSVDTYYLVNSCPHLESAWHEVLRLYTSVTSTRYITKDTMINNAHLKKGHAVLFSARQMAFHDTRLGENPLEFDATRFHADLKRKNLDSHRHFGGGKFMCCGRHLTKHVHATFVAQLLRKYDVSLAFPQKFPGVFDNEPSIGVLVAKDDLYLQLKERV
jgi:cytochrome P450